MLPDFGVGRPNPAQPKELPADDVKLVVACPYGREGPGRRRGKFALEKSNMDRDAGLALVGEGL